jgi:uncharacterized protein YceH (UPF0502 family)
METIDLQAGLRSLNASLRRMRDLLAWGQLKQQEARRGEPPSFQIYDPTATDLRNEYSHFLSTSIQIHGALHEHRAAVPAPVHETLQRRLAELEQEAHQLNLHQRCLGY